MSLARTQEQILARIADVADDDFFGFRREVLIAALDLEHATQFGYLKPGVITAEEWDESRGVDKDQAARDYLTFAIGKILDHRGISANRSVEKLGEFAWLLGRDDVVAAMENAGYPQYGAPQVKAFAEGMGWPWPDRTDPRDVEMLERMAAGKPCRDDCESGCGL